MKPKRKIGLENPGIYFFTSGQRSANINSILPVKDIKPANMSDALVKVLATGVQMALENCQQQFKWDRWNCPDSAFSRKGRQSSTKETAYVTAVTAAGIVFSVTKSCSRGELPTCGCDPNLHGHAAEDSGLLWGGCSDHVAYGEKMVEKYLDTVEQKRPDWKSYTNLHNNAIGRMVVRQSLERHCKCHGLSGSCTTQTCWKQLPKFKVIATALREKYEKAMRMDFEMFKGKNSLMLGNAATGSAGNLITESEIQNLVYMEDSPNYCDADVSTGWMGTIGRSCSKTKDENATLAERKSCKTLCRSCGLRVRRKRREVSSHCNCSFRWCCEVNCETCTKVVEEHYCE